MKILVMGLPGSGKTWFSEVAYEEVGAAWFNADKVRAMANDWDFSIEGRQRQAMRMRHMADFESNQGRIVICDFVCPTKIARQMFKPDYTIWMNTIKEGRFEDTNKLFEQPDDADLEITDFISNDEIKEIIRGITQRRKEKASG